MKFLRNLSLVFATLLLVACGEKKEKEADDDFTIGDTQNETRATEKSTSDSKFSEDDDVVELSIEGNDQMRFNKTQLKVKAGQKVRLTLKHTGQMDVNVMGHNWVLLKQGTSINEFGNAAVNAKDNDYIPQGTDAVIAHTEMIGGGQTTIVEFEAPEAGEYDFICSFPGHYSLMKGKFIVE